MNHGAVYPSAFTISLQCSISYLAGLTLSEKVVQNIPVSSVIWFLMCSVQGLPQTGYIQNRGLFLS